MEAAVTLPMLFVLVFGAIEAANAIFLKQTLTIASYEAAKIVSKRGGTTSAGRTRFAEVLASRGFTEFTFRTDPEVVTLATPRGSEITIDVSMPASSASLGPLHVYDNKTLTKKVHMVRL